MKRLLAAMLLLLVAMHPAVLPAGEATPAKLAGLLHNEDCTNFFYFQDFPQGKSGEIADRYVDVLADAGVTVLMCNTNARRTNYRSQAWQAFWDGYIPDGPDDQAFLRGVPKSELATYRKLVGAMLAVDRDGIDYPARIIQRCRQRGISPWISLRMNDVHNNDNLDHPFHDALWRKPDLFRRGEAGYFARALDYAHQEVRDHYRALVVETLSRYDLDGLELDFLREPYLFSRGHAQEGQVLLTRWIRDIRQLVNAAATRRGHPIRLGVRVPSHPEAALGLGLDAPTWARQRLVDLVVVAPRWSTLQYNMPLARWRQLLGDQVTLAGGLEVRYEPYPGSPSVRLVDNEDAAGAAAAVLAGGADVVYLFNYFQHGHPSWQPADYRRLLRSFSSIEALWKIPRRHNVTYRDVLGPNETYRAPLPASGQELTFELPLGPKPPAGWKAEATLETTAGTAPSVAINGVACAPAGEEKLRGGNRLLHYAIPPAALPGQHRDAIAVRASQGETVKVLRVEVRLRPAD